MLRVLGGLALLAAMGVGGSLAILGDEPLRQVGLAPDWPSVTGAPVVQASATRDDDRTDDAAAAPRTAAPAAGAAASAPAPAAATQSRFSPEFVAAIGASLEESATARRELSDALASARDRLAATREELEAARDEARTSRLDLARERDEKAALQRAIASGGGDGSAGLAVGVVEDPAAEAERLAALRLELEQELRREMRPTLERQLRGEIETALRPAIERSLRDELAASVGAGGGSGANGLPDVATRPSPASLRNAEAAFAAANAAMCGAPRGLRRADGVFEILENETDPYRASIDGPFAPQNSFRWAASLKIVEQPADQFGEGEVSHRCSGAVIDRGWIVTAAHCLTPGAFDHIEVTVGSTDLHASEAITVTAERALCHSGYDHRYFSLANDIALVPLDRPLPESFPTVEVATPEFVHALPFAVETRAAGWGALEIDANGAPTPASQFMKAVALELKDVHGAHLYAADENPVAGVCRADSGGPLAVGDADGATLIGVATHVHTPEGKYCATTEDFNVFTNVGLYRDWIDGVIGLCAARDEC